MSHKAGNAPDLAEINECMAYLRDVFPAAEGGIPPRRRGHSMVVHAGNRTGKELLHDNLDRWLRGLTPPFDLNAGAEIPF